MSDIAYLNNFKNGTDLLEEENLNGSYKLNVKTTKDIIANLNMSREDKLITESIILNLEKNESDAIKLNHCITMPAVGTIQRRIDKLMLRKYNKELKDAAARLNKEEYKNYFKILHKKIFHEIKVQDARRAIFNKLKFGTNKKFTAEVLKYGYVTTCCKYLALTKFKVIEFDQELQDKWDELNGIDRDNMNYDV